MTRCQRKQLRWKMPGRPLPSLPLPSVQGKMIVEETWEGHGATATIGLKDADLALEAAAAADMPLPSTHIWRDHLPRAIERGEGALDWAVMARQQARASGLDK